MGKRQVRYLIGNIVRECPECHDPLELIRIDGELCLLCENAWLHADHKRHKYRLPPDLANKLARAPMLPGCA